MKGWFWAVVRTRTEGDGVGGPEWLNSAAGWSSFPGHARRWTLGREAAKAAKRHGATAVKLPAAALGGWR